MPDLSPSEVRPLASSDPITFAVSGARCVEVQVRFYSDTRGVYPVAAGDGSRTLAVSKVDSIRYDDLDIDDQVESVIPLGSYTATGGTWAVVGLGSGADTIKVIASGGSDPAGAASYRVWVRS